jgi:hypothetical protein
MSDWINSLWTQSSRFLQKRAKTDSTGKKKNIYRRILLALWPFQIYHLRTGGFACAHCLTILWKLKNLRRKAKLLLEDKWTIKYASKLATHSCAKFKISQLRWKCKKWNLRQGGLYHLNSAPTKRWKCGTASNEKYETNHDPGKPTRVRGYVW